MKRLAAASLLARHWPGEGSRHDVSLAGGWFWSLPVPKTASTEKVAVFAEGGGLRAESSTYEPLPEPELPKAAKAASALGTVAVFAPDDPGDLW